MSNNSNSSVLGTILSICITLFLAIRIAVRCSGSNSNSTVQTSQQMDNLQKMMEFRRQKATEMRKDVWKNFFYGSYKRMDSTASVLEGVYGIQKLAQDSLVRVDIKSKIRIPKESFYFNNYDENLRFIVKFPDNTNFMMHDIESKRKKTLL